MSGKLSRQKIKFLVKSNFLTYKMLAIELSWRLKICQKLVFVHSIVWLSTVLLQVFAITTNLATLRSCEAKQLSWQQVDLVQIEIIQHPYWISTLAKFLIYQRLTVIILKCGIINCCLGGFATGDGVKMASAMGAEVVGMDYIQVHRKLFENTGHF